MINVTIRQEGKYGDDHVELTLANLVQVETLFDGLKVESRDGCSVSMEIRLPSRKKPEETNDDPV